MKKRTQQRSARYARLARAILGTYHVAVINIDPSGWQGLIDWKYARSIAPGQQIADAVCDVPHRWTIYFAALCADQGGQRYMKSSEIELQGQHYAEALTEVIEQFYAELRESCNPQHLVASGWIASPCGVSLTEQQADRLFEVVGAWNQRRAA